MAHTLPGSQDMQTAYRNFKKQHPSPIPATPPYTPTPSKHEPIPPVTSPVPPLLLAPKDAKPTQTTVIYHGAKWRIPKHHMTAEDLLAVPLDSQHMPGTCWACDHHTIARIAPHSTPPAPPHGRPITTGLRMGCPVVPPCRYEPHSGVQMPNHHNAHLAPPRAHRNRHPLEHARTRQNGQTRTPL